MGKGKGQGWSKAPPWWQGQPWKDPQGLIKDKKFKEEGEAKLWKSLIVNIVLGCIENDPEKLGKMGIALQDQGSW